VEIKIKKSELALSETENRVLGILKTNTADLSAAGILRILKGNGIHISERKLREIKSNLILKGYPIGSSYDRGYFYIRNDKDLKDAQAALILHAKSELQIANKLAKNIMDMNNLLPMDIEQYEIISMGGEK